MKKFFAFGLVIVLSLQHISAQYYRYGTRGWGHYNNPGLSSSSKGLQGMAPEYSLEEVRYILGSIGYKVIDKYSRTGCGGYANNRTTIIVKLDDDRTMILVFGYMYHPNKFDFEEALYSGRSHESLIKANFIKETDNVQEEN